MRTQQSRWARLLAPVALLVILVFLWAAVAAAGGTSRYVLPTPAAFIVRAGELFTSDWFWQAIGASFWAAALGSLLGALVAIPLSWLIYRSPLVSAALQPFLGATQALPAVALAPLLMLWVGRGLPAIVVLCALMVFFPILVSTTVGLRGLDPDVLDAAALDGATGWRLARSVELPLVSPSLLAGVRNGFTLSITGAVVGEMVMGGSGLGQLLVQQQHNFDTAGMFVTVFTLALLAVSLYSAVYFFERRIKHRLDGPKTRSNSFH